MIFPSNCRNDKKPDFVPFNHTLKLPNCRELLGRKVRLLWTKDDTEVYFRIQVHMEISQFAGKFRSIYLYNYLIIQNFPNFMGLVWIHYLYNYYRIVPKIVLEIVKKIVTKKKHFFMGLVWIHFQTY